MPTFDNGEDGLSVRTKINNAIAKVDGIDQGLATTDSPTFDAVSLADGSAASPSLSRAGDADTGIFFPAADTVAVATGGVVRWTVDSSGNLLVGTTTSPSGSSQIVASGGVYLGGTGSANKLDSYEEGAWTINLSDATSGGNLASFSSRFGYYTKVGNLVTVEGRMIDIDTTGMTGGNQLIIQGLPFSAHSTGSMAAGNVRLDRFNLDSNTRNVSVLVNNSSNNGELYETRSGLTDSTILVSAVSSEFADLFFSLTYRVTGAP